MLTPANAKGRSTKARSAKVTHLPKGRPPRDEAEARRRERADELLRAAAIVLARRGIRSTPIDALADELGIPKSVLYRYFDSREELVHTILRRFSDGLNELQSKPWRGLANNLREVIAMARANPSELLLLVKHCAADPVFRPYFDEVHSNIVAFTEGLLQRSSPSMAADATLRRLCSQAVAGFLLDAVLWWIENADTARDDDFVRWAVDSLDSLYRRWMPDADWTPRRSRNG
jgi:AcrR family transcriptional regulator